MGRLSCPTEVKGTPVLSYHGEESAGGVAGLRGGLPQLSETAAGADRVLQPPVQEGPRLGEVLGGVGQQTQLGRLVHAGQDGPLRVPVELSRGGAGRARYRQGPTVEATSSLTQASGLNCISNLISATLSQHVFAANIQLAVNMDTATHPPESVGPLTSDDLSPAWYHTSSSRSVKLRREAGRLCGMASTASASGQRAR